MGLRQTTCSLLLLAPGLLLLPPQRAQQRTRDAHAALQQRQRVEPAAAPRAPAPGRVRRRRVRLARADVVGRHRRGAVAGAALAPVVGAEAVDVSQRVRGGAVGAAGGAADKRDAVSDRQRLGAAGGVRAAARAPGGLARRRRAAERPHAPLPHAAREDLPDAQAARLGGQVERRACGWGGGGGRVGAWSERD
jgi:hypothetical protein